MNDPTDEIEPEKESPWAIRALEMVFWSTLLALLVAYRWITGEEDGGDFP